MNFSPNTVSRSLLDFVLPPRCVSCGIRIIDPGALCKSCFGELSFITEPNCICCGLPFEYAVEGESHCGACLKKKPAYAWARAALRYDDMSSHLILSLKHSKKLENAPTIANMMRQAIASKHAEIDLFIPVPLHRRRLFSRRFNQSALLAQHLGDLMAIPCDVMALHRIKATPPQVGLTRSQRKNNMRGAFQVNAGARINNKNIALIDDVHTTGATATACAKILMKAGAKSVGVVTLARVVKAR